MWFRAEIVLFITHLANHKCFNLRAQGDAIINGGGYVMHEQKASALRNLHHYCIIRVRQIKTRG